MVLVAGGGLAQRRLTDLDTSFDGDGKVFTGFATANDVFGIGTEFGAAVAIQDDGKIVVGGQCRIMSQRDNFCLARYTANGTLDTTFDGDGKVDTSMLVTSTGIAAVLIQSDDKIVAAGTCGVNGDFCVARYNVNGSLDTTFDTRTETPSVRRAFLDMEDPDSSSPLKVEPAVEEIRRNLDPR